MASRNGEVAQLHICSVQTHVLCIQYFATSLFLCCIYLFHACTCPWIYHTIWWSQSIITYPWRAYTTGLQYTWVWVWVSSSIFPYSNESAKKTYTSPQRCNQLIQNIFFCKTLSSHSYRLCIEATSAPISHFACPCWHTSVYLIF